MKPVPFAVLLIATLLSSCTSIGDVPTSRIASATMRTANGLPAGTALLTAAGEKLTLTVAIAGLPAGLHGIHLHAVGRCDAPDFVSAGPHLNPGARQHGAQNPAGSHLGDLPNLVIDAQGKGAVSVELGAEHGAALTALFDSDGSAIVLHAAADDYKTDPTGNSGARIACGVLQRS